MNSGSEDKILAMTPGIPLIFK